MGMSIKPEKMQKLQEYTFNISYIIIIIWACTTDIIIEYSDVTYYTPAYIAPLINILDLLHLVITIIYFMIYFKCKFALAKFRSQK
jgi:hypothetical protein